MTGGYPQQGYQARPPTSWAPPGPPMQQSGYGYVHPGAYPGPSPQYGVSQPPYGGYPQPASAGGYATGWDQTNAATNQQTAPGSGYDYYGQQQPQQQQTPGGASTPADSAAYGYNQPPASGYHQGQGYTQDGYGGYQAPQQPSYGQTQPNPAPGYDQQQGYNTAAGYGNVTNPTPEGSAPSYGAQGDANQAAAPVQSSATSQQGYNTTQQPNPSPASYPPQGSTQTGYGAPPTSQTGYGSQPPSGYGPTTYGPPQTQKPPSNQSAYGQPQQSPSAQGSYAQPGFPHSQPPSSQSGYGTAPAQGGYALPPYGAPPAAQPGYGQQPPPYNSTHGGYSQAPLYSADGSAAPASQTVQPSGVAKASPQS